VRELHAKRPHVVSGYPSTLARAAREVDGADLRSLGLRFLCTGGEVLTPVMREQIVQAFGAPLYDWYGSHEFNLLAWQCAVTGAFHSCDDGMITEILDDDRPVAEGEEGEIIGTDLISLAMPMIRYRLGDLVTKGPTTCACGQPFSTIRNIQGRRMDYFRLPGGRVLHPYELAVAAGLLRGRVPWIREYQVIQERMDRIAMRVVPFQTPSSPQIAALTIPAQALLGPAVQFHLELVPEIPFDPSGKFRVYQPLERSADGAFSAVPGECR
ncbi:MAG: phenylacetate--CoA ligase family protein, partial [Nitrospiraceae bacterium]